jgi:hypothetical protein
MGRSKLRRLHVSVDPPVTVAIGDRRVTFLGVNLLNNAVIVEYAIEPPLLAPTFPQARVVALEVTDDVSDDVYTPSWEDFPWPDRGRGRVTTRLDRRPPAEARWLHVVVRPADSLVPQARGRGSHGLATVARFDVELPPEHGLPWQPEHET